jgi:hypothetical protein
MVWLQRDAKFVMDLIAPRNYIGRKSAIFIEHTIHNKSCTKSRTFSRIVEIIVHDFMHHERVFGDVPGSRLDVTEATNFWMGLDTCKYFWLLGSLNLHIDM